MKHILLYSCTIFAVVSLLAACTSNVKRELYRAEGLSAMNPDSTFAILGNINRENLQEEECRQLYDLAWAEAYYIKSKNVTDSIDKVLSRMRTTPGTRQHLAKKILHSIYLYGKGNIEKAFENLDECRHESDIDIHPYWKAVVEDYLGIIYLINSEFVAQSRSHFYKVLDYAQQIHDRKTMANAYSHISCYHLTMGQPDSALSDAFKVFDYCSPQDSQMMAIAYHNLANIQMYISEAGDSSYLDILHQSRKLCMHTADTLATYALLSQAYFLHGKQDSAYMYQAEVERGNHNYAKLILYKFLADYYDRTANTDSAYKYLKLHSWMDSACALNKPAEALLNITYLHNQEEAAQKYTNHQACIVVIAICIILFVVSLLGLRHRRIMTYMQEEIKKQDTHIETLHGQNIQLADELDASHKESNVLQGRLDEQGRIINGMEHDLADAKDKTEYYKDIVQKKNSQIVNASRTIRKYESINQAQSRMVSKAFLDKSVSNETKMNKSQMEYVIDAYKLSEEHRYEFVRSLSRHATALSPTTILICILYHEGFSDGEIISKLHYNPLNFRMAKSRARATIDTAANRDSAFVRRLLDKF